MVRPVQGLAAALFLGLSIAFSVAAQAAGPEVWAALQDARLAESADRDPVAAIAIYETLLHHLDNGDSLRGELLIQLARARFDEGDHKGARAALVEASDEPLVGAQARAWRVQVDASERRVLQLPLDEDFGAGTGPFVLGWSAAAQASISGGATGLTWHTVVRDGRDDYILAAVDPAAGAVRTVALDLLSRDLDASVRLIIEDDGGRRFTTPVIDLPAGQPVVIDPGVSELLAVQPGGPSTLDPATVRVVLLQDVTAFHAADRGPNQLEISRFVLR